MPIQYHMILRADDKNNYQKSGHVINFYEQLAFTAKFVKCLDDIIGRKVIL